MANRAQSPPPQHRTPTNAFDRSPKKKTHSQSLLSHSLAHFFFSSPFPLSLFPLLSFSFLSPSCNPPGGAPWETQGLTVASAPRRPWGSSLSLSVRSLQFSVPLRPTTLFPQMCARARSRRRAAKRKSPCPPGMQPKTEPARLQRKETGNRGARRPARGPTRRDRGRARDAAGRQGTPRLRGLGPEIRRADLPDAIEERRWMRVGGPGRAPRGLGSDQRADARRHERPRAPRASRPLAAWIRLGAPSRPAGPGGRARALRSAISRVTSRFDGLAPRVFPVSRLIFYRIAIAVAFRFRAASALAHALGP